MLDRGGLWLFVVSPRVQSFGDVKFGTDREVVRFMSFSKDAWLGWYPRDELVKLFPNCAVRRLDEKE